MKTIMIRNVPEEQHRELRHIAVDRAISLNALMLEMIKSTVEGEKKGGLKLEGEAGTIIEGPER